MNSSYDDFFKAWMDILDKYSYKMGTNCLELSKHIMSYPGLDGIKQSQLNFNLLLFEYWMRNRDQFFKFSGIASQEDVARIGRALMNVEEKIDHLTEQAAK
ncbi:MAG: hypothetical protein HPY50_20820 [Firmicutes bacterium]|nr:hypothetical protein [Bacillota bacterium]